MLGRRLRRAAALCAIVASLPGLAACAEEEGEPRREGLALELGGVTYNVFITRQLNLKDPEDRGYVDIPDAPPGSTYYGVFLRVCNEGQETREAARTFRIVDTQGAEFEPKELEPGNEFVYAPRKLAPGKCIPEEGSLADSSPTGGSLLLFQLPVAAAENRPLELEVLGEGAEGKEEELKIELDI